MRRAAGVTAVSRPHQALPQRLGVQHDDHLGIPSLPAGRPGDGKLLAVLLIPLTGSTAPISFTGDLILFAYLLGLGRFFAALAALDTGSAFEGMGAAREVTFACLAEPALLLGLIVLAKLSGSLELATMLGTGLASHWSEAGDSIALVLLSWFIVLLVENSRIPFDDPNTHLELTMIHEVMVLDHSGPAYGMILYLTQGHQAVPLRYPDRTARLSAFDRPRVAGLALSSAWRCLRRRTHRRRRIDDGPPAADARADSPRGGLLCWRRSASSCSSR